MCDFNPNVRHVKKPPVTSRSAPLTKKERADLLDYHLPYRFTMLSALADCVCEKRKPTQKEFQICAYQSAIIAARVFAEFIGLRIETPNKPKLKEKKGYFSDSGPITEVKIQDLKGSLVALSELSEREKDVLARAIFYANKATAHIDLAHIDGFPHKEFVELVQILEKLLRSRLGNDLKRRNA